MRATVSQVLLSEIFERQRIFDVFVLDRKFPARRHHADYGVRARRNGDLLADNLRVAAERVFPKRISENHDAVSFVFSVFAGESAAKQRLDPQDLEYLRRNRDSFERLGIFGER